MEKLNKCDFLRVRLLAWRQSAKGVRVSGSHDAQLCAETLCPVTDVTDITLAAVAAGPRAGGKITILFPRPSRQENDPHGPFHAAPVQAKVAFSEVPIFKTTWHLKTAAGIAQSAIDAGNAQAQSRHMEADENQFSFEPRSVKSKFISVKHSRKLPPLCNLPMLQE